MCPRERNSRIMITAAKILEIEHIIICRKQKHEECQFKGLNLIHDFLLQGRCQNIPFLSFSIDTVFNQVEQDNT